MKELREEFYQKFGKEIVLTDTSEMEKIIKEADVWWEEKCPGCSRPRLKFKHK